MKIRGVVLLPALLAGCALLAPLWAQITPTCERLEGQVTFGLQGYSFDDDPNFLRQYRSFPEGDFRGNLTDADVYLCPNPDRDQKIEFHRRNPHRLVETNSLLLNLEDVAFRVQLWRYRHRPLEVFPVPTGVGSAFGSVFNNDIPPGAFFRANRTRFEVEARVKGSAFGNGHLQNIFVRFRNEQRTGLDQFRFLLGGADRVSGFDDVRWRQEGLDLSGDVNEVQAGLILGRPRNYALALLWLTDRYSNEAPLTTNATIAPFGGVTPTGATKIRTDGTLGLRTFDFIPDSRVLQPELQFLKGWSGDKHLLFAAYTFSRLDQERLTPLQAAFAGGYTGRLQNHVVSVSPIIRLAESADLRAFLRDEIRNNDSSFGPGQFLEPTGALGPPRLDRLMRLRYGFELNYRPKMARSSLTLEVSQRHTERDLTFGVPPSESVPAELSLLRPDTDVTTIRLAGRARPTRNSSFRAEYRFQTAQNTGLPVEPDLGHRFDFEAGYDFGGSRLLGGISFHFQENRESNDSHIFTGLIGDEPQASFTTDFVNNSRSFDTTLWLTPGTTPLTFTVSFNRFEDDSQQNFFTTNRRRFEVESGVLFTLQERTPYENTTNTGSVGINYQINPHWALHSSFVINESSGSFTGSEFLSSTLAPFSQVDNRLQTVLAGVSYFASHGFDIRFEYSHDRYNNRVDPLLTGSLNTFHFAVRKKF